MDLSWQTWIEPFIGKHICSDTLASSVKKSDLCGMLQSMASLHQRKKKGTDTVVVGSGYRRGGTSSVTFDIESSDEEEEESSEDIGL